MKFRRLFGTFRIVRKCYLDLGNFEFKGLLNKLEVNEIIYFSSKLYTSFDI